MKTTLLITLRRRLMESIPFLGRHMRLEPRMHRNARRILITPMPGGFPEVRSGWLSGTRSRALARVSRASGWWVMAQFALGVLGAVSNVRAATTNSFLDRFETRLDPGWTILREQPGAWRIASGALEIRVQPGNMWGPANDAKNTFVRPAPDPSLGPVEVSVRVENRPTEQYEQVDLLWYYADSHQVKIGQELVDGQLSIVMGREEADRTRTIAIIPITSEAVDLRLVASSNQVTGAFRTPGASEWREAGSCDLPVHGEPRISLQVYQGPAQDERWARLSRFAVRQVRP
jgi:hypothetical protein